MGLVERPNHLSEAAAFGIYDVIGEDDREGFIPDHLLGHEYGVAKAEGLARASGGSVSETEDRAAAFAGAHVVYAKEWGTTTYYGDFEADSRLRAELSDWCIRERWFEPSAPGAKLMHCLPVRRNVAVSDEILDGPRAVVAREAFNRLVVQMAVLHRMLA